MLLKFRNCSFKDSYYLSLSSFLKNIQNKAVEKQVRTKKNPEKQITWIVEKQVNLTNFYWETSGNKEQIKDSKGVSIGWRRQIE